MQLVYVYTDVGMCGDKHVQPQASYGHTWATLISWIISMKDASIKKIC